MKNLRPETMGILEKVEEFSGRPVEFKPDSSLPLRATLKMARNGAPSHVLHYRPSNEPIDYWVAYQASYALRLVEQGFLPLHKVVAIRAGTPLVLEVRATGRRYVCDGTRTLCVETSKEGFAEEAAGGRQ